MKIKTEEETTVSLEEGLEGYDSIEIIPEEEFDPKERFTQTPMVLRNKAFELYMDHTTFKNISEALGVKENTIKGWAAREGWSVKRKENDEITLREVLDSKKMMISGLVMEILSGVTKAIRRDAGKEGFKSKDVPTYLSALSSIEKLSRLSLGLATSISEERSKRASFVMPIEHLKNVSQVKITQDPFKEEEANEPTTPNGTGNSDSST